VNGSLKNILFLFMQIIGTFFFISGSMAATDLARDCFVFVGTYTSGESDGIYVYRMDTDTGALAFISKATGVENPSYPACLKFMPMA